MKTPVWVYPGVLAGGAETEAEPQGSEQQHVQSEQYLPGGAPKVSGRPGGVRCSVFGCRILDEGNDQCQQGEKQHNVSDR